MEIDKKLNVWEPKNNKGCIKRAGEHLYGEGFELSFNPRCFDNGNTETALIVNDKYYILTGDYRTEYSLALKDGLRGVIDVFRKHYKEKISYTSSLFEELENDMRILAPNDIESFIQY